VKLDAFKEKQKPLVSLNLKRKDHLGRYMVGTFRLAGAITHSARLTETAIYKCKKDNGRKRQNHCDNSNNHFVRHNTFILVQIYTFYMKEYDIIAFDTQKIKKNNRAKKEHKFL